MKEFFFKKVTLLKLALFFNNLIKFALAQLRILLATHFMWLEEGAELDKMILDEDVFLS